MAHIGIVTGAHLCRNPRVVKEATALREAGHRVTVLGPATDEALSDLDAELVREGGFEHRVVVDVRPGSPTRTRHRLVRKVAIEACAGLRWERPEALGYGVRKTLAAARKLAADLTIGHQEVGVYIAAVLSGEGRRTGADIEDWHSEDQLMEGRRRPRRLLRWAEAEVLQKGSYATTTSHALAQALAESFDAPVPAVVYNAFSWADRESLDGISRDRLAQERLSLHWVSQTIGPGRGLEELCAALWEVATPVDVHLRGRTDEQTRLWLHGLFPADLGHRLVVHDLVPPQELLSRIAEHDIGLALEWGLSMNHDLTVSNKILHYLLAGLAVIATDTQGQKEVARAAPDAVCLCRAGDARSLALALKTLIDDRERLQRAKAASLQAARERYNWDRQAEALVESVEEAVLSKGGR